MHATVNAWCGFCVVFVEPSARTARGAATVWRTRRDEVGMVGCLDEVRDMMEYKSSRCATCNHHERHVILWSAGAWTQRVSQARRGISFQSGDLETGDNFRNRDGKVCRDHAALAVAGGELVTRAAMHEHADSRGVDRGHALREQRPDHTGEHVTATTRAERRAAGRIDRTV